MALKDLVSDLSNFKTKGDVAYDKLDPQIENGVDYFPDDTSGAKGFTPSTDLLTKYNKFMKDVRQNNTLPNQYDGQANISAPNAGVRENFKSRRAYGSQFEYSEPEGVGISKTSHILSLDNQLGIRIQPKFTSAFMTTPLADYVSSYNPPVSDSLTLTVPKQDGSGNWTFDDKQRIPSATTTDFMSRINFTSKYEDSPTGAGSQTLNVVKVKHTVDNLLATKNANYTTAKNEGPFSGVSNFSVDTMKKTFNDGKFINIGDDVEKLVKFRNNNFTNVPSGMNDINVQTFSNFRTVANRGPHEGKNLHPIILRKPTPEKGLENRTNWDNYLNEKGIISEGGFFEGALSAFGLLTRTSRDLADKQRIGTYLLSDPGKLFIAKQFAFQALNPTLESKIYNPLSTLGIAGASDLLSGNPTQALGGILRAASSFLFPTHVERHLGGLRYENVLKDTTNKNGRLYHQSKAFKSKIIGIESKSSNLSTGIGFLDTIVNNAVDSAVDVASSGATAAVISLPFSKSNPNKYGFSISSAPKSVVDGRPSFVGGPELAIKDVIKALDSGGTFDPDAHTSNRNLLQEEGLIKRHSTLAYSNLKRSNRYEGVMLGPKELNEDSKGLTDKDYDSRIAANDIVKDIGNGIARYEREAVVEDSVLGAIKGNMLSSNVDKVNITPYGATVNGEKIDVNDSVSTKDFIKFRFYDITNDKYIIFRAILEAITDTVTPNYSEENYIGRPDKVFVYQNVDRTISFTFSIYPKTKQELPVLMEKLNYLVGLCYPTFSQTERMQAPFMQLTMGDMFNETPGILTGLTVTVEEASTWELDEGLQFPHFIKAACEFRHIGSHIPDARGKHYDLGADKGFNKFGFDTPFGADSRRNSETTQ